MSEISVPELKKFYRMVMAQPDECYAHPRFTPIVTHLQSALSKCVEIHKVTYAWNTGFRQPHYDAIDHEIPVGDFEWLEMAHEQTGLLLEKMKRLQGENWEE